MDSLPFALNRRVVIAAPRDVVFRYFTDSERWARWWGEGSTIDARPGGSVRIVHPGGVLVTGRIVSIDAPTAISFTYGYVSGAPIPADGSLVTISLGEHSTGTELRLSHVFAEAPVRDQFVQGWRYQLAVFGNVTANEANAAAGALVDGWFAAWSEPDSAARDATLDRIAATDVTFHDQFSLVGGLDDLRPHLAAVHRFMPGVRVVRDGAVRHCQGTVLANWIATGPDGAERGRGTNVFTLDGRGRIRAVTGIWGQA